MLARATDQLWRAGEAVRLARAGLAVAEHGSRVALQGHFDEFGHAAAFHDVRLVGRLAEHGVERERLGIERFVERRLAQVGAAVDFGSHHHLVLADRLDDVGLVVLFLLLAQWSHSVCSPPTSWLVTCAKTPGSHPLENLVNVLMKHVRPKQRDDGTFQSAF